ncbi:hypothetical protein C0431_01900 [bacterium]|nr:hypothetical protein CCB80_12300 [Armatimonadetes bacterium Uphvl-Ar1]MBA4291701.1 hypothetical protein [bacterium]
MIQFFVRRETTQVQKLVWKEEMQFYDLKTRSHVDVPEGDIRKTKMIRKTKNGEQVRYALKATYNGSTLFKFVNEATFKSMDVPEV